MALFSASYADFRTAVGSWLDWSNSTTTQIDDLIVIGENKVYRHLRTRVMETALASTITSGVVAVPDQFIEMKFAYINSSPAVRLLRKSAEWIYEHYSDRSVTNNEAYFAREGSNFIFGPAGGDGNVMTGIYYARATYMAVSSTINSIFSAHPDVFLFAAISEGAAFTGEDQRTPMWEAKFQQLVAAANREAKDEDQSGSRLFGSLS